MPASRTPILCTDCVHHTVDKTFVGLIAHRCNHPVCANVVTGGSTSCMSARALEPCGNSAALFEPLEGVVQREKANIAQTLGT